MKILDLDPSECGNMGFKLTIDGPLLASLDFDPEPCPKHGRTCGHIQPRWTLWRRDGLGQVQSFSSRVAGVAALDAAGDEIEQQEANR